MKKKIVFHLVSAVIVILLTGCASNESQIADSELTPIREFYEEEIEELPQEEKTESSEEEKEETAEEEVITTEELTDASKEDTQIPEEEPKNTEQEDVIELEDENNSIDNTQVEYHWILNTNTKKVHKPSCSSVTEMKEKNKKESNLSPEELKNQGYEACKRCNPF